MSGDASTARPSPGPIVVAGHVCLDLIPQVESTHAWAPGQLVEVGRATVATGGAVANTGIALHRLGVPVRLRALIGDDLFGEGVRRRLDQEGEGLADGLRRQPSLATSYTVVLSPPGQDRTFLHCPGGNDAFGPEHLDAAVLSGASHLHFGYPPLMRRMYSDGGETLSATLAIARAAGLTTSLDLSLPDPSTAQGRAPWAEILARALPSVDLFTPSLDELAFMLGWPDDPTGTVAAAWTLSGRALDLGAGAVALKCGSEGLLLRTGDAGRLARSFGWDDATRASWTGRSLWSACFAVDVVGTTGSGDTTIAGLLQGLWRGQTAEDAVTAASAVGAACCEGPDATGGVRPWPELAARLGAGWSRRPSPAEDWRPTGVAGVSAHPEDGIR